METSTFVEPNIRRYKRLAYALLAFLGIVGLVAVFSLNYHPT
jgi:hypothetical protein